MKRTVFTKKAPAAIGPFSQGVITGGPLFVSGQLPVDPITGEFAQRGIKEQTHQSLENLTQILASKKMTPAHEAKPTAFLNAMDDLVERNAVYQKMLGEGNIPARSAFEVTRLPKDALAEIEPIAAAP